MPAKPDYTEAEKHLSRKDSRLRGVIKRVGPCTLRTNPDAFGTLARSIISQQISGKAADSIGARLLQACGKPGLKAGRLQELTDEQIRGAGISSNKLLSLRSLCQFFQERPTISRQLKKMEDEEVIETLLPIRGVGRWTAQMFLIFSLGRQDVLPIADLGFRSGIQHLFELDDLPDDDFAHEVSEPWKPYRSIATWYLWRSKGPVPQSA